MIALLAACRACGWTHEPDRAAIVAGTWHRCAGCRAAEEAPPRPTPSGACHECGRPLRAGGRTVCARCLGVST